MRSLLAYLLLHANELVSSDRLIDEVWGPEPPKTAGASLQNYISRLRKAIGAELIVSQAPGYILRVDPERFDLARFERLTAEARGAEPRERAEKLRAALSLWRGPALEDLAFEPFARDEVGRLEEARLAALEERIDAELALGSDADVVGELEELVAEHPLRERFRRQLMHALYRAGRQADALAAYQEARRVLMDELGLEPSEEVRRLQQAILQQDASLGPRVEGAVERAPDRRTVTVLFCDLVESTRLASALDPEAYRRLISRYFEIVRTPIQRHGGTVEKFIGDAVMAVFGVPELHEDDALRAVRAAAEIRAAIRELDAEAAAEWDVRIAMRIGVNTGEVHVLSGPDEDLRVSGPSVSIASRLEQKAFTGEILLGEETMRLVRDAVRAEPLQVEGTRAWQLKEVIAGTPPNVRRLDSPLVGREDELRRLLSALEHVRDEAHCRVVTVVGEAGIGKTRLIQEFMARVGEDARALIGRCVSYGEGATYLPLAEIVRQAASEASVEGITALLDGEEGAAQVAQRVAELTGLAEGPAAPGEAFWAVRRLIEAIARDQTLLLVLDDLHWAEPTLLDLVEYLGEWAEGSILVLSAARRELLESRPSWGGPTSTGFIVELGPLPGKDVSSLVLQLAGEPVDPEVEARIVEHAGGNPLFAEQLLALSAEAPELGLEDPPPTVEALLASRLDRLDPDELAVLRRASVVGRRFSREELDDLTPKEEAARTQHHLVDLAQRALVHPADDVFRFHHVLVRDVAYRGIPKAERAHLHERAARGLDRRDGADELVGYHFERAFSYLGELGTPDENARELAVAGGERLGRAGIRAWKRADVPAALNLLERATGLLPEKDEQRRELLCELGVALRMRGELDRAQDVLGQAVRVSEAENDSRLEHRARVELTHVRALIDPNETGEHLEVATNAIPVFEAHHDERSLGRAWMLIGHVQGGYYCDNAAWAEASAKAAEHYGRAGWSPSTCLGGLAAALFYGPTPVEDALGQCESLLEQHAGDHASEANILVWAAALEAMRGRFDAARLYLSHARTRYEELGQAHGAITCGFAEGVIEMLAQRPKAAEAILRESCAVSERLHEPAQLANRAAELSDALYVQRRYEEAENWARVAEQNAGRDDRSAQAAWRSAMAKVIARRGTAEEAERLAREAVALIGASDCLNDNARSLLDLAEVLNLESRRAEADAALESAIALYDRKGNVVAAKHARRLVGMVAAT
jgi:class 3 adenylate cyclase/tetratricopeptide (TPR) repeat protein